MKWSYDNNDGRYYVEGARISYTNFTGSANEYNNEGSRNFKLRIDESLYNELRGRGVMASMKPPREEGEEPFYSVKVGLYRTSDVYLLDDQKTHIPFEDLKCVDDEISRGKVINGEIDLSFHVSRNTKKPQPIYYLRTDTMYIPVRQNRFDQKYANYGAEIVDDDDYPM